MEFKRTVPHLGNDATANTELLLGYIEDLKSETEAKITLLESTIDVIKDGLAALTEVSQ